MKTKEQQQLDRSVQTHASHLSVAIHELAERASKAAVDAGAGTLSVEAVAALEDKARECSRQMAAVVLLKRHGATCEADPA